MTSRTRTRFRCSACDLTTPVWNGRCNGCDGWNTLVEETHRARGHSGSSGARGHAATGEGPGPLAELSALQAHPVPVGVSEVDRVLSGGLVPGSVTLLSGPPGVGKSTLALQIAAGLAVPAGTAPVVYVAAEETIAQIRLRADRLGLVIPPTLLVTDDPSVDALVGVIDAKRPAAVIVDSVQAIVDHDLGSVPGSVTQVRGGAQRLASAARIAGSSLVLIGHVTKDGAIAGPRTLEHLVDTVITFDADLDEGLRFLRAIKHRFGPVGELGVFTMGHDGLRGMNEIAGMFLEDRRGDVAGSVVCPVRDGRRTMLAEIQALVRPRDGSSGDRHAQGLDPRRVDLVLAVLEAATGVCGDTFVSVTGGLRATEPGVDLAVAIAVQSAALGVPVAPGLVVCGEVGLTGEVRRVRSVVERLTDAAALGFTRAVVPAGTPPVADELGIDLVRVPDLVAASRAALVAAPISGDSLARKPGELRSVHG